MAIDLVNCTPPLVSQLNVINKFAGDAKIMSVFSPFICTPCGADETHLVDVSAGRKGLMLSAIRCTNPS
jgi:eukaryotic-like serine/threonine-protein kinase